MTLTTTPAATTLARLSRAGLGGLNARDLDPAAVAELTAAGLAVTAPVGGRVRLTSRGFARAVDLRLPGGVTASTAGPLVLRAVPASLTGF